MKIYPEGNRFIKEVIEDEEYDVLHYYPIVIDIGAGIGVFSFWMYDNAEEIYAIEPVRSNLRSMKKTIEENNLKRIKTFQLAISNTNSKKKLERRGKASQGGWRIGEKGTVPVDCRTLGTFMKENKLGWVDLVKIDVEGHEAEILEAKDFPYKRIGTIVGEVHTGTEDRVSKALERMGYEYLSFEKDKFLARK